MYGVRSTEGKKKKIKNERFRMARPAQLTSSYKKVYKKVRRCKRFHDGATAKGNARGLWAAAISASSNCDTTPYTLQWPAATGGPVLVKGSR